MTAISIRFPPQIAEELHQERATGKESINQMVVSAVEDLLRRRKEARALKRIRARRERLLAEYGAQPDSTELIRDLRQGIGRNE
ncbi:MAG: YlcI/YnfO family protein [Candidatus Dormibacteraceae bacterium]